MNQPNSPVAAMNVSPAEPVSREELNSWKRGFTPQAEIWNGRLAMVGLAFALLLIIAFRLA